MFTPIGTVALFIINPNVTVEYLSFDIIMMDQMVGKSSDDGDFLINGIIPPLVLQAPLQSLYSLTISTDSVSNTSNTMDIIFSLFASVNISSGTYNRNVNL